MAKSIHQQAYYNSSLKRKVKLLCFHRKTNKPFTKELIKIHPDNPIYKLFSVSP